LLGVAVLAKGLVPLALAAPLVWPAWKHRNLARALPRIALPLVAVCLPWYGLCYLRNGPAFLEDFFVKHHFDRFASGALQHREPWWFYLPVLAGALLPWAPLLLAAARRGMGRDPRRLFLLLMVLWGLLLFSASVNKLPGYVLPLVPACAVLMAVGLEETGRPAPLVALCGLLLVSFPLAGGMLPGALLAGLSRTPLPAFHWIWLVPLPLAAVAGMLARRGRRLTAVACVACGAVLGVLYLKEGVMPDVDRVASARPLWRRLAPEADRACVEPIHRDWRYGLNYYSVVPLPDCPAAGRPIHVFQTPGHPPEFASH
jgi:4-amino-4-deoxy-L-arabinose transferase-like glycosyltransferase